MTAIVSSSSVHLPSSPPSAPLFPHVLCRFAFSDESTSLTTSFEIVELPSNSHKALKRYLRWERDLSTRTEKRRLERRQKRERKKMKKQNESTETASNTFPGLKGKSRRAWISNFLSSTSLVQPRLVIDLAFFSQMQEGEKYSLIKQIRHFYGQIVRAPFPLQLICSSTNEEFMRLVSKNAGYQQWLIQWHEQHFQTLFPNDKIVYLTAESDETLHNFRSDEVYIIGGLVDHNRLKGLVHQTAVANGWRTARLPIQEALLNQKKVRTVITINQVGEIALQYWQALKPRLEAGLSIEYQRGSKDPAEYQKELDEYQSWKAKRTEQQKETNDEPLVDWGKVLTHVLPQRSNWKAKSEGDDITVEEQELEADSESEEQESADSESSQQQK